MQKILTSTAFVLAIGLYSPVVAQVTEDERQAAATVALEISTLMVDLEERAAGFPEVLAQLRRGEIAIEQADEIVAQMILQLQEATDAMEDNSAFDNSIDGFKERTRELIAEAEASDNEAIRDLAGNLQETLAGLEEDDANRARAVVDARNLIADLEDNREAYSFFIRAGEVQQAAALIAASVDEYADIIARGQAVADQLIQAANP